MHVGTFIMTLHEVGMLLAIAVLCGNIARALAGDLKDGILLAFAVGVVGALAGSQLVRFTSVPEPFELTVGSVTIPLLWSVTGGVIAILLGRMLRSQKT